MKISFVGAGNAAWNLACALKQAGHTISWIYNRTLANASLLANEVGAKGTSEISNLADELSSDLIIVCTRDDGYKDFAKQLQVNIPMVHTSGSIPLSVLNGCSKHIGVFYPLQSMLKARPTDFSTVPFCLEANTPELMAILKILASDLSSDVYELNTDQRKKLHLGAIFASNFSNFLYILSKEYLAENKLPNDILDPLILETAVRILGKDPKEMQTGPARRGDVSVIKSHLEMLEQNPTMQEVYQLMSEQILKYYQHPKQL